MKNLESGPSAWTENEKMEDVSLIAVPSYKEEGNWVFPLWNMFIDTHPGDGIDQKCDGGKASITFLSKLTLAILVFAKQSLQRVTSWLWRNNLTFAPDSNDISSQIWFLTPLQVVHISLTMNKGCEVKMIFRRHCFLRFCLNLWIRDGYENDMKSLFNETIKVSTS